MGWASGARVTKGARATPAPDAHPSTLVPGTHAQVTAQISERTDHLPSYRSTSELPRISYGAPNALLLSNRFASAPQVTAQISERTGHLPGVAIAIMGCIVNGPGQLCSSAVYS